MSKGIDQLEVAIDSLLDQVDIPQAVSRGSSASDLVEMLTSVVAPEQKRVDRDHIHGQRNLFARISLSLVEFQVGP